MARTTTVSYEAFRQAANRFWAVNGRKPTILEMKRELGGGTEVISRHMQTWREEVRMLEQCSATAAAPSPLVAAFSAAVAAAVTAETATLTEQLNEIREDAEDLRNELGAKSAELVDTQDALDKERQRCAVLEAQLNDSRIDSARNQADLGKANEDLIRLNQDLGRHQSELAVERQKSSMLETQLAVVTAAQAALSEQIQTLRIDLAVAQNRRQEKANTQKEKKP